MSAGTTPARAARADDVRKDHEELAGHPLTADEQKALKAGDIDALYPLGANPDLIRRVFRPRFKI